MHDLQIPTLCKSSKVEPVFGHIKTRVLERSYIGELVQSNTGISAYALTHASLASIDNVQGVVRAA